MCAAGNKLSFVNAAEGRTFKHHGAAEDRLELEAAMLKRNWNSFFRLD